MTQKEIFDELFEYIFGHKNIENEEYTDYEKDIITQYAKRIGDSTCKNAIIAYNYLYGTPTTFCDSITKCMVVYTELLGRIDLNLHIDDLTNKKEILLIFKRANEIESVLSKLSFEDFVGLCGFKNIDNIDTWQKYKKLPITRKIGGDLYNGLVEVFLNAYASEKVKREGLSLLRYNFVGECYCVLDIGLAFVRKYGLGGEFVENG